ncbi:MAG: glycosyltransferase family 4 protein, partial [Candidatus Bathyarchaeota archaeon]|nr:glycosyltransferase family 4 protein [Candidatus Bathyarchaeota archaeon]
MLIVHVFHHYYPIIGGMERAVQGLAEAQASLGHEVYVVTSKYGAKGNPPMEVLNNVHIYRVDAWRLHYPDLTIPKNMPKDILNKADIVHVHGHNSLFSINMLEQAFKLGVKTACFFMAVDAFKDHPNPLVRHFAPLYDRRNTKKALALTNLRLVKSLRDLYILRKKYCVDAKYLPDAVPEYYFAMRRRSSADFLGKYGIKQKSFFLFVGRMHKLKGPHVLVEALKYLNKDIAVVFIGPDGGFLSETLKVAERLGVKDRVYFLGYV